MPDSGIVHYTYSWRVKTPEHSQDAQCGNGYIQTLIVSQDMGCDC